MIIMGGNPAEAHPVSLQHLLEGKELNRANFIVIDPRLTRTAAHATEYVRIRPGTDIPVIYGMLWHIFKNGWEDKEFIQPARLRHGRRPQGSREVDARRGRARHRRSGGAAQARRRDVRDARSRRRLIWAWAQTQHTVGTANVRASCILLLATGNVGSFGNGANIFRGHCNVQGATDLGLDIVTLPLYYGLAEGAWKHWCRVWEVDYDWMLSRFDIRSSMMEDARHPVDALVRRDAAAEGSGRAEGQPQGHDGVRARRQHRHPHAGGRQGDREARPAGGRRSASHHLGGARRAQEQHLSAADLHAVRDATARARPPTARCNGASRSSSRSSNRRTTTRSCICWPRSSALPTRCSRTSRSRTTRRSPEDILREINRGGWSTGYCGQSPERLKAAHGQPEGLRSGHAAAPKDGPARATITACRGRAGARRSSSIPAPTRSTTPTCTSWTAAAPSAPASASSARSSCPTARTRKDNLLAEGSYSLGSEIKDGYPEFTYGVLKKLGWDKDLTEAETCRHRAHRRQQSRRRVLGDRSLRRHPAGRDGARLHPLRQRQGARQCLEPAGSDPGAPRADLHAAAGSGRQISDACRTPSSSACPISASTCRRRRSRRASPSSFPIILTSGRLVEYEGGGEETRSNKWLAELQQDMFVEINPADAAERGIKDGAWVHVWGPEMESGKVTPHEGAGHRARRQGRRLDAVPFRRLVPERRPALQVSAGRDPIVLGESVNTITTYGFDPVTGMQEPKATLCQIRAA